MVGNDGPMGLWRIWTISHGHLDHSRHCLRRRYRVAPAIGFLVMRGRSLTVDARPFSTRTSRQLGSPGWRRCVVSLVDALGGHPHFEKTEEFCRVFDQVAFDPNFKSMPLQAFDRCFERCSVSLANRFISPRRQNSADADQLATAHRSASHHLCSAE